MILISMNEIEMMARIEAALYAAGKPLSIKDIQYAAGTESVSKAARLAREVAKVINSNLQALEVVELQDGSFVLQLKLKYNSIVRRFASKPLLSNSVLKTLSCIAYMQPVSAKELVNIRGSQVYSHLKLLLQSEFIKYEKVNRNKVYRTTKKFQDYFGIEKIISKDGMPILEKT